MTIGERIKKIRKDKNLTQQAFAERMKLRQNTITRIETGNTSPSPAVISLICRTFQVNENWLRTGEGEPYATSTRNDELFQWAERLAGEDDESFPKKIAVALSRLDSNGWAVVSGIVDSMLEQSEGAARPEQSTLFTPEELAAYEKVKAAKEKLADPERAALHRELDAALDEKKRASAASASSASSEKLA